MATSNLGTTRFIRLHFHITVHYQRESGPELIKHGRSLEEELMQRLWRVLLSLLSYSSQDLQPRDGTTHSELNSQSLPCRPVHSPIL